MKFHKAPLPPISLSKLLLSRIFRETNTLCSMPAEFYLQFVFTLTSSSPSSLIFYSFSAGWQVQTVSISYLRCLIEHVRCYLLDRDIELIYYTIRKSSDVLTRDPMQLGAQVSSEKNKQWGKSSIINFMLSLCSCNYNIYLFSSCISLFLPSFSPPFFATANSLVEANQRTWWKWHITVEHDSAFGHGLVWRLYGATVGSPHWLAAGTTAIADTHHDRVRNGADTWHLCRSHQATLNFGHQIRRCPVMAHNEQFIGSHIQR